MKPFFIIISLFFISILFGSFKFFQSNEKWDEVDVNELTVELVLENISGKRYPHKVEKLDVEKAEIGRQIIFNGKAKKGKRISPYFVCIDCHNTEKETEESQELSPEKRLEYSKTKKLPFLPGSTFWGIYNRTSFYNGDYYKKYGEIIKNAKDSLRNAIQVCGKYCSSGRYLNAWELDALMHYFKKNELKIKDLNLKKSTYKSILYWQKLDQMEKKQLQFLIESSFVQAYPATFLPTMPRESRKYGEGGNVQNGEYIYEKSCLYCHENKRVTFLSLSKNKITAKLFVKHLKDYSDLNIYQIIRYGTYAKVGRKQYMPHYTKEKMSDQQIEDVVAYIKSLAVKNK